jgi:hypothetical protein
MEQTAPRRRSNRRALFLAVGALPIGATLLIHQLLGDPVFRPGVPISPFAIAPHDHVGPLEVVGFSDLGALAVLSAIYGFLLLLLHVYYGHLRELPTQGAVGLALLLGGAASNSVEVLMRGAALDWLWISLDGQAAIVANAADAGIISGVLLTIGTMTADFWGDRPR